MGKCNKASKLGHKLRTKSDIDNMKKVLGALNKIAVDVLNATQRSFEFLPHKGRLELKL